MNADTLLAIQETEQIIKDYSDGSRIPRPFSNAREMFTAMDLEDEAEYIYNKQLPHPDKKSQDEAGDLLYDSPDKG